MNELIENTDFKSYSEFRQKYFEEFSKFSISSEMVSKKIILDKDFFDIVNNDFRDFLHKRKENKKFSASENTELKDLLKEKFPQVLPVFQVGGATVYWFEINHSVDTSNKDIHRQYILAKSNEKGWWSKCNRRWNENQTSILYLGKVLAAFQNRFIQHIGFGHIYTSALKINRWIPSINGISLCFYFLNLDSEKQIYIDEIEKVLWYQVNPLLGKAP